MSGLSRTKNNVRDYLLENFQITEIRPIAGKIPQPFQPTGNFMPS
jgi:hypothetical protein